MGRTKTGSFILVMWPRGDPVTVFSLSVFTCEMGWCQAGEGEVRWHWCKELAHAVCFVIGHSLPPLSRELSQGCNPSLNTMNGGLHTQLRETSPWWRPHIIAFRKKHRAKWVLFSSQISWWNASFPMSLRWHPLQTKISSKVPKIHIFVSPSL